jgi:hypothetical protein
MCLFGTVYRWTLVSAGNTFQDLPQLRETADNTKRYTVIPRLTSDPANEFFG